MNEWHLSGGNLPGYTMMLPEDMSYQTKIPVPDMDTPVPVITEILEVSTTTRDFHRFLMLFLINIFKTTLNSINY